MGSGFDACSWPHIHSGNLERGIRAHLLERHPAEISPVAIAHDADRAVCGAQSEVVFWDLAQRRIIRTIKEHSNTVTGLAMSADGRYAMSVSSDGRMNLWEAEGGSLITTLGPEFLWDRALGPSVSVLAGHSDGIRGVTMNADGSLAVSCADDQTMRLWDLDTREQVAAFGADSPIVGGLIGSDGSSFLVIETAGRVHRLALRSASHRTALS